jgi:uncharacterized protein YkwD
MPRRHRIVILVLAACVPAAGAPAAWARPPGVASCASASAQPTAAGRAVAEAATLCLVNRERTRRGLRPLRANRHLAAAARDHSTDMVRRGYFEHGAFATRIRSHGYGRGSRAWTLGENIAWGNAELATPASIVDAWMHSPGHRANILYRGFKEAGVGVAAGVPDAEAAAVGGATYTLDFGARG